MVKKHLKSMDFDGDIIITDPCYIVKKRDESDRPKWSDFMSRKDYSEKALAEEGLTKEQIEDVKNNEFFPQYEKLQEAEEAWESTHPDDWEKCNYGDDMDLIGLNTCITSGTIYGDWGCTTFDSDTKEPLGEFCADAGMVGVFDLSEVLNYNPAFDYHINRPWTTTLIKNFKGEVHIDRVTTKGDDYISVVGKGIDKVTGKPICFFTRQTSL